MLFDLSDPRRKNFIRVVYAVLAALFLIGFVGFGIGGELGGGGILDSLGGGGGGSAAEQFEDQIEDEEDKLEADPENERVLARLAGLRFQSGQAQLEFDEQTQAPKLTDEARSEFEAAVDTWERYLATDPRKPSVSAAGQIVQAYVFLGDAGGAADAQQILAEANPSVGTYAQVADFRYRDLDLKGGDAAVKKAKQHAEPGDKAIIRQLEQLRELVVKEKKRLAKSPEGATGDNPLSDPFGSFGGDAPGGVGGTPVQPAP